MSTKKLQEHIDNIRQVGGHMDDKWISRFGEGIARVAVGEAMNQIRLVDKLRIFLELGIWAIDPEEHRRYRQFCFHREVLACGFGEYLSGEEIDKAFDAFDLKPRVNKSIDLMT